MRERFGFYYKRFVKTKAVPPWEHFEILKFLGPFIDLKEKVAKVAKEESDKSHSASDQFDETQIANLIELVKARRNLFDKSHENFRNSAIRKRTWNEVGLLMGQTGEFCSN